MNSLSYFPVRHLKIKAIAIPIIVFYVLTFVFLPVLSMVVQFSFFDDGLFLFIGQAIVVVVDGWTWAVAPYFAGRLAARMAGDLPYWHGMLTGLVGFPIFGYLFKSGGWWLLALMAITTISFAAVGAGAGRRRGARKEEGR